MVPVGAMVSGTSHQVQRVCPSTARQPCFWISHSQSTRTPTVVRCRNRLTVPLDGVQKTIDAVLVEDVELRHCIDCADRRAGPRACHPAPRPEEREAGSRSCIVTYRSLDALLATAILEALSSEYSTARILVVVPVETNSRTPSDILDLRCRLGEAPDDSPNCAVVARTCTLFSCAVWRIIRQKSRCTEWWMPFSASSISRKPSRRDWLSARATPKRRSAPSPRLLSGTGRSWPESLTTTRLPLTPTLVHRRPSQRSVMATPPSAKCATGDRGWDWPDSSRKRLLGLREPRSPSPALYLKRLRDSTRPELRNSSLVSSLPRPLSTPSTSSAS